MPAAPTFTIFTPTYNRAHTLARVYRSLLAQTFRNFEWLIVDDGSRDGTADLVRQWPEADFPIRYIHQENVGKHVAFNRAVREARGELFLPLDSDDACVPEALERLLFHWRNIPVAVRDRFSGVSALCVDEHGELVGNEFPRPVLDSDSTEIVFRFGVRGEKWGFHRTSVLRMFPFPELPGSRFIPESVVWSQIARHYQTRFVNERLRIYYTEGAPDQSLSTVSDPARHAPGLEMLHRSTLNHDLRWFAHDPVAFCRSTVHYLRFALHQRIPLRTQLARVPSAARVLCVLGLPIAYCCFLLDRRR